jgi:SAM-dependent methyltransferase
VVAKGDSNLMEHNTFIDKRHLAQLRHEAGELMAFDSYLRNRLSDSSIDGLKAWEYGKLVNFIGDFSNMRVLDVGPGDSTFCLFLARKGAWVTTIDYPQPMVPDMEGFRKSCHQNGVGVHCGTMLQLPYKDESFDLVLCISTIEHLDVNANWEPIPYSDFLSSTKRALLEMGRVLKKGGYLYLTSDAYEPELQETDNWSLGAIYRGIGAAYSLYDIEKAFVNTIEQAGLALANGHDYRPSLVIDDPQRSNYRGRYFTTFCVLAQK